MLAPKNRTIPRVDGNGRTTRLLMNMIQRQLDLVSSIVRKEDKGEYIQSLVDSREKDNSTIAQDTMLRHHIANLNRTVSQYQESDTVNSRFDNVNDTVKMLNKTLQRVYYEIVNKPDIRSVELMEILKISSTVTRATRELKKLGYIERKGSDKTGKWVILNKSYERI